MRISIVNSNSQGMIRDASDTVLPLEQWTWLEGVRVADGKLKRFGGPEPVGLIIDLEPTGIFQYRRGDRPNALFLVDDTSIWYTEGGDPDDVSGASAPYSATPNDWTYTNFNGVPILNNHTNKPQAGETFPLATMVDMSNWPADWRAQSIRSFKTLLIALNLTISGVELPHQFAHSDIVEDPFIVPGDWTVADPSSVAGLDVLSDVEGPIVDGLTLRELFVIYKDRQAYVLTLGGSNVFTIYPTFAKGLLAKNCVATITVEGSPRHFCVGQEDIYLSTGYAEQSLTNDRLSEWFYSQITVGLEPLVHVKHHQARGEVWVIFPRGESATECNTVLIYNYRRPAFYLFPLTTGVLTVEPALFNIAEIVDDSWAAAVGDWASDHRRWVDFPATFNTGRLVAVSSDAMIYLDEGATTDVDVLIERTGLAITGKDWRGNPTYDPDVYKLVNDFWPRFSGSGTVSLEVLVQELPDGPATSHGSWEFTIGDKRAPSVYAAGNLIGIRVTSLDSALWQMIGYDLDIEVAGS